MDKMRINKKSIKKCSIEREHFIPIVSYSINYFENLFRISTNFHIFIIDNICIVFLLNLYLYRIDYHFMY